MNRQRDFKPCETSEGIVQPRGLRVGSGEPELRVRAHGKAASATIHGRGTGGQRSTQTDQKYGSADSGTPEASD